MRLDHKNSAPIIGPRWGVPIMASAALDRLLHRATVINIKGDSYRMREKRQAGLFPGAVALEPGTKRATPTTKPRLTRR